jgi:hypothetical protein
MIANERRAAISILETTAVAREGHAAIGARLGDTRRLFASNSGARILDHPLFRAAATKKNVSGRPRARGRLSIRATIRHHRMVRSRDDAETFPAEKIVSALRRQSGCTAPSISGRGTKAVNTVANRLSNRLAEIVSALRRQLAGPHVAWLFDARQRQRIRISGGVIDIMPTGRGISD